MARINNKRGINQVPNTTDFNAKFVAPDISVKDLNSFVFFQGVRIKVYKSLWCPNRKSIDGSEHPIDCPLCDDQELIDVDPLDTFVAIQGQSKEQLINPEQIGYNWEEQTVLATFLSGVEVSYYTKVELQDYTNIFKELVQRQVTGQVVISSFTPTDYTASTGVVEVPDSVDTSLIRLNDIFTDSIGSRFVIEGDIVEDVGSKSFTILLNQTVDLNSGATVVRPDVDRLKFKAHSVDKIIDDTGIFYEEDADFIVDRNGDIEWLTTGSKPIDKAIYSILYNTLVSFRAIRAIHSNRFGTLKEKRAELEVAEYPQQWILKKLYLFRKEDSESGQKLEPNKIFPPE